MIEELEEDVINTSKEGVNSITIAARTGFCACDVAEIIDEDEGVDKEVSI